jgi:hypothetical protein
MAQGSCQAWASNPDLAPLAVRAGMILAAGCLSLAHGSPGGLGCELGPGGDAEFGEDVN